ncbi:MAG: hypothetical protein K9M03_03440 [Kiritimatiellales bacterium]|nr:hypothetical protein [Kiritimatiellales bacterium]
MTSLPYLLSMAFQRESGVALGCCTSEWNLRLVTSFIKYAEASGDELSKVATDAAAARERFNNMINRGEKGATMINVLVMQCYTKTPSFVKWLTVNCLPAVAS